jgi:hypothetical protein
MPGCLSYLVAQDASDGDGLWIAEVWDSTARHEASIGLPAVQAAMVAGRPLIEGCGERSTPFRLAKAESAWTETVRVCGPGLRGLRRSDLLPEPFWTEAGVVYGGAGPD